ncbi:hypothetical protein SteCoe_18132 [Stentor coeruleus]|uniref:Uncharacterized protein n=1 Tax=Stentor coeruleus TaxID=5963 RepID=A0A1R2BX82_9CILI|nr:hypothetical protein SteCoe_18132 [Stentor coeruleus]
MINARSQSSLSTLSLKGSLIKTNPKDSYKAAPDLCLEVTYMAKNKHDLEEKILQAMDEVKKLKHTTKNLKNKDQELDNIHQVLFKSEEDVVELRNKYEKSENLIMDLHKAAIGNDDDALLELSNILLKQTMRFRQFRNSLIIDDMAYRTENIKHSIKTSREMKIKSPYFSQTNLHVLTTPRVKKIQQCKSSRQAVREESKPVLNNQSLQQTYERVKTILQYLAKDSI